MTNKTKAAVGGGIAVAVSVVVGQEIVRAIADPEASRSRWLGVGRGLRSFIGRIRVEPVRVTLPGSRRRSKRKRIRDVYEDWSS